MRQLCCWPFLANALLQWPEKDRVALAILLQDSVKEGFASLEQAKQNDKELITYWPEDAVGIEDLTGVDERRVVRPGVQIGERIVQSVDIAECYAGVENVDAGTLDLITAETIALRGTL